MNMNYLCPSLSLCDSCFGNIISLIYGAVCVRVCVSVCVCEMKRRGEGGGEGGGIFVVLVCLFFTYE